MPVFFVGRLPGRHELDKVQSIFLIGLPPQQQMAVMDRIKGASHNSDLCHICNSPCLPYRNRHIPLFLRKGDLPLFFILCLFVKDYFLSDNLNDFGIGSFPQSLAQFSAVIQTVF